MHRPIHPPHAMARFAAMVNTVAIALLVPMTVLARIAVASRRAFQRARDDDAGVSEIAVIALITGLAAILVIAYMAIVSGKVEDEANNLPTSGG